MSSQVGDSLAILGQFLLLVLLMPGLVYTVFIFIFFPQILPTILIITNWASLLAIIFFLGLTITAICIGIEMIFLQPVVYPKIHVTPPEIPLLGKLEARGKSTIYLNQVFGQYIMHLNVSLGVLILTVLYVVFNTLVRHIIPHHFALYTIIGIVTFLANAYAAFIFTKFAQTTVSGYESTAAIN